MKNSVLCLLLLAVTAPAVPQTFPTDDPVVRRIWTETMDSSQLPVLAHQLLDVIGPRLTGTPGLLKAGAWVAATALMAFGPKFLWNKTLVFTLLAVGLDVAVGVGMILGRLLRRSRS